VPDAPHSGKPLPPEPSMTFRQEASPRQGRRSVV
jgi:hypothetical protein